jgi:hypothetical protein
MIAAHHHDDSVAKIAILMLTPKAAFHKKGKNVIYI